MKEENELRKNNNGKNLTGYPSIDKTHEKINNFFQNHQYIPNISVENAISLMSLPYRNSIAVDCLEINATYQEMLNSSKVISKSFKELGIKKGDIITVSMPNFYQAVAIYLAANRIGAVITFLNPGCSIEEIKHYINEFESPLFINYDKNNEYNENIKKDTKLKQIITLDKKHLNLKNFNEEQKNNLGYNDFISYYDLKLISEYYKNLINPYQSGKQDSLILFTSGSTGMPKSVVLTNENILASGFYMKNTGNIKSKVGEKCLVCVPFTYPYGFATSALMALLCGRVAILAPNLSKENISYFLSKNPNYIFGSPALLELIRRNIEKTMDLSSIHSYVSGGDFLSPSQALDGKKFFKDHNANVEIFNGSGNAETSGASTIAVGSCVRPETVGRVLVGSKAIIVDPETLEEKKYNEEGMLCISGKHVFKGYYNQPELTSQSKFIYKGREYLKTGTIGSLDEEGYFKLTGRASRFFIRSDLNKVYCEHIQKFINNIDCVDSCAVVAKPDDSLLYTSKAYIVLKDNVPQTEETINYINDICMRKINDKYTGEEIQLKDFEIPQSYTFVKELPKTQADKIDFKMLEELAAKEYEEEKNQVIKLKMMKK